MNQSNMKQNQVYPGARPYEDYLGDGDSERISLVAHKRKNKIQTYIEELEGK